MNNFFYWLLNPKALLSISLIFAGLLIVLSVASCSEPVETLDDMPEVPEHVSRRSKG
jgi:hypothetical protein